MWEYKCCLIYDDISFLFKYTMNTILKIDHINAIQNSEQNVISNNPLQKLTRQL